MLDPHLLQNFCRKASNIRTDQMICLLLLLLRLLAITIISPKPAIVDRR